MHGYKNVGPHNYPGTHLENGGKRREHLWSSRQRSADQVYVNKLVPDWKPTAVKLSFGE